MITGAVFWLALILGFWLRGTKFGSFVVSWLKRDEKAD